MSGKRIASRQWWERTRRELAQAGHTYVGITLEIEKRAEREGYWLPSLLAAMPSRPEEA